MIPDSFKQDLLNRVDIVDVVSRYVQLKKGGANYLGLCPFHGEKTPSFTVSPAKQFYHCFGCAAHGNAIGFLMAYAGLGYVDAVKDLAAAVGIQVPEVRAPGPEEAAHKERETDLYAVMEKAMDFYRAELKKSPHAIEYLKRRGLTGEIAARFRIGYAPDDWQALKSVFEQYSESPLVECGLVIENEGKRYDRFRDRIMFPIFSARGAVVGFGGRVIADAEPKYLNSPETPLFEKGREVYGLGPGAAALPVSSRGRGPGHVCSQPRQGRVREAGRRGADALPVPSRRVALAVRPRHGRGPLALSRRRQAPRAEDRRAGPAAAGAESGGGPGAHLAGRGVRLAGSAHHLFVPHDGLTPGREEDRLSAGVEAADAAFRPADARFRDRPDAARCAVARVRRLGRADGEARGVRRPGAPHRCDRRRAGTGHAPRRRALQSAGDPPRAEAHPGGGSVGIPLGARGAQGARA